MNARTTLIVVASAVLIAFGIGLIKGTIYGGHRVTAKIEKKGSKDVKKAEVARAAVEREPVGVCLRDKFCRRAD